MKFSVHAVCLLGALLVSSCQTSSVRPEDWKLSETKAEAVELVGRFVNVGTSSDPKVEAPRLSELIFEGKVEGFEVDSIDFLGTDQVGRLLIQPLVGEIPIPMRRFLDAERRKGEWVWTAKTETSYADGYVVTASVLWTGGMMVPLASWVRYRFHLDEDGSLLVHFKQKDIIDFFLFFPVPFSKELWLRYPAFSKSEAKAETP